MGRHCILALVLSLFALSGLRAAEPALEPVVSLVWGVDHDDVTAMNEYQARIKKAWLDHEFDRLEEEAKRCVSQDAKFPSGDPEIFQFYLSFGQFAYLDSDKEMDDYEQASKLWLEKYPRSVTAWLARSKYCARRAEYESKFMFLYTEEQKARGRQGYDGYLKAYGESAAKAYELERDAPTGDPMVPFWTLVTTMNGAYAGLPAMEEALKAVEARKNEALLRKELLWFHSPLGNGDLEGFQSYLKALELERGPEVDFEAAAWLARGENKKVFSGTGLDLKKIELGFRKQYESSHSLALVGRMAYLACLAERPALAKEMLGHLGDRFELDLWKPYNFLLNVQPYLQQAGIEEVVEEEAWFHATKGGKDPKGEKAWQRHIETAVTESAQIFSPDLEQVKAYVTGYDALPHQAREASQNAFFHDFSDVLYGASLVSGTAKEGLLKEALEKRVTAPDLEPYAAYLIETLKALVDPPGRVEPRRRVLADVIVVLAPSVFVALEPILSLRGQPVWLKLKEKLALSLALDPQLAERLLSLVQADAAGAREVALNLGATYRKSLPLTFKSLRPSIEFLAEKGNGGQEALAKVLLKEAAP